MGRIQPLPATPTDEERKKARRIMFLGFSAVILLSFIPILFYMYMSTAQEHIPTIRESAKVLQKIRKYFLVKFPAQGLLFADSNWKLAVLKDKHSELHVFWIEVPDYLKSRLDSEMRRQQIAWIARYAKIPIFTSPKEGNLQSINVEYAKSLPCLKNPRYLYTVAITANPKRKFSFFSVQYQRDKMLGEWMFAIPEEIPFDGMAKKMSLLSYRCLNE